MKASKLHKWLTFGWLLVGGAITWIFPDSVPWVAFMSLYANIVGHWSSYQAAKADEHGSEQKRNGRR